MEATGVYWFALYDMIEQSGIDVCLVKGREVRNVPGRKSDVEDCQWIQQLHSFGLLRPCFIPDKQKVFECDKKIQELLEIITKDIPAPPDIKPPKRIPHNIPQVDNLHEKLMKLTGGKDPSQITGLTDKILLELIGEVGTDLFYNIMTKGIEFVEKGVLAYQHKVKEQQLKRLQKQAKHLGLKLLPMNP
jgi:transposase